MINALTAGIECSGGSLHPNCLALRVSVGIGTEVFCSSKCSRVASFAPTTVWKTIPTKSVPFAKVQMGFSTPAGSIVEGENRCTPQKLACENALRYVDYGHCLALSKVAPILFWMQCVLFLK
ncbi:hypothetical protein NPIL_315461 [Nephila pilipes]|uniref:Uncharacterized protein n=1 Tax=Nephila pilipes TaxID=299642 RepID=A0A8X6UGS9_NEPPI|nr:hypothetical protein NPIL_315461 [Nephila pilipes]